MMKSTWWVTFLGLVVLNLILVGPIWGKESPADDLAPITDSGRYQEEYLSAGALKFFENSEDALRLAQFERALMRFRFLKGHIQGKKEYTSLLPMVDMRLHFLKRQMHLHDWQVAAITPPKVRKPKPKTPEVKLPPPPPPTAKAKNQDEAGEDKKEPVILGPLSPPAKAAPPPVTAAGKTPEAPAAPKAKEEEKTEDSKEGEDAKPTPLPPNFWQKMKIRLHLQKKAE